MIPLMLTVKQRRSTIDMKNQHEKSRIESLLAVNTYLDRLRYALSTDAQIFLISQRQVDRLKQTRYTNRFTINKLFPDEDVITALRRELLLLKSKNYIETVRDSRFPNKSEMRVFGNRFAGQDTYIKIRVELINLEEIGGNGLILVMSFHFAEYAFKGSDFPYGGDENGTH